MRSQYASALPRPTQPSPLTSGFREDVRWWEFEPAPDLIAEGKGDGAKLNTAMRTAKGDALIAYLAHPTPIRFRADALKGNRFSVQWMNPATGEKPEKHTIASGTEVFVPRMNWSDSLLYLVAE